MIISALHKRTLRLSKGESSLARSHMLKEAKPELAPDLPLLTLPSFLNCSAYSASAQSHPGTLSSEMNCIMGRIVGAEEQRMDESGELATWEKAA